MRHHARRVSRLLRQQRFFSFAIAAAFLLIVVSGAAGLSRTALGSPEVKFTDASASGLQIVPASCPSDPTSGDTPWGCNGSAALCSDGSIAPNNDVTQCTCAQGNTNACTGTCPDGSAAPHGNTSQCTCAQGNTSSCQMSGTISASPGACTIAAGASTCDVTVNWSTSNAPWSVLQAAGGSFGIAGQNVQGPTQASSGSGTYALTAGSYVFAVAGSDGSSWQTLGTQNVFVSAPPQPNLTASAVSPASASSGFETNFSATVSNSGGAGTGTGFSDLLQQADDANGTGARDLDTYDSPALPADQSNTASFAETFTAPGTVYLRVCADKSSSNNGGVIAESDEADNCGPWSSVSVGVGSCPDGSLAPGGNASACTCASGNIAACTAGSCPDGSAAAGGNSNACTCAQGNAAVCGNGGGGCTDPNTCKPPSAVPGCNITTAPKTLRPGNTVLIGWASSCASAASGCTALGLPEVAGNLSLTQTAGGSTQTLGAVQPSGTAWAVPTSVPATYKVAGQLYAGYWPLMVPVAGSQFSCQVSVQSAQATCFDGSAPVNGQCPNNNSCQQQGFPRCGADGTSIQYLDSACHVKTGACPWAAQGYGCVNVQCLVPPPPSASFNISPKLLSPNSTATIAWQIGESTSCSITATDGDNTAGLTGSGSKTTAPVLGQTVYTLNCAETLTGQTMAPQSITVNVVPQFIEK